MSASVDSSPAVEEAGRRSVVRSLLDALAVVALLAVVGAVAGAVWEWLWSPPRGVVVDHRWVVVTDAGLRGEFGGTGWYVVVGTVAGLLAGAAAAAFWARVPLLTLLAVVVGSALGAWLMMEVGTALGPADPHSLALTAAAGSSLPAELTVSERSPLIAYPGGALVGLAVVFVGLAARTRNDEPG